MCVVLPAIHQEEGAGFAEELGVVGKVCSHLSMQRLFWSFSIDYPRDLEKHTWNIKTMAHKKFLLCYMHVCVCVCVLLKKNNNANTLLYGKWQILIKREKF